MKVAVHRGPVYISRFAGVLVALDALFLTCLMVMIIIAFIIMIDHHNHHHDHRNPRPSPAIQIHIKKHNWKIEIDHNILSIYFEGLHKMCNKVGTSQASLEFHSICGTLHFIGLLFIGFLHLGLKLKMVEPQIYWVQIDERRHFLWDINHLQSPLRCRECCRQSSEEIIFNGSNL